MTEERFGYDEPETEESEEDVEERRETEPARGISAEDALLQAIADAGEDSDLGRMASEVLVARKERQERNALEASRLQIADSLDPEGVMQLFDEFETARVDPEADPALVQELSQRVESVKEALRAQVRSDNEVLNDRILREMAQLGLAEGRSEEQVTEELTELREQISANAEYEADRDVLADHPVMRAYEERTYFDRRARALAEEMSRPSDEAQAAEAQRYVDSVIADTLAVTRG